VLTPATASAHGLVGRADLPVPSWLFAWTASAILGVSFLALFALWKTPLLRDARTRALPRVPRILEVAAGIVGIGLFGVTVVAGFAGQQDFTANFAPTFVYVIFWVGIPVASVLLGDVFRPFNPWRAMARTTAYAISRVTRSPPRPLLKNGYPPRLGRWPAAVTIVCFAWLELVYPSRDDPRLLAILALVYASVQLAGMATTGIDAWTRNGDGFAVYFRFVSLLSPLGWRGRRPYLRWPLSGAPELDTVAGTTAVLCALLGTTSFDGFSNGDLWLEIAPSLQSFFQHFGFSAVGAFEVASTIGLLFWVGFATGLYLLGVRGMAAAVGGNVRELARSFAHTLIPIAVGYVLAHYISLLVLQGQAMAYLISDPLGHGTNYFGTADFLIDYNLISFSAIWYIQIAAIVGGHVGGLVLSHERGLVRFRSPEDSRRAQYWMLTVMVAFSCLALWILSAVSTTG